MTPPPSLGLRCAPYIIFVYVYVYVYTLYTYILAYATGENQAPLAVAIIDVLKFQMASSSDGLLSVGLSLNAVHFTDSRINPI